MYSDGDWVDTIDDSIGTLGRYTYTDAVGSPISSTATAKSGYKFIGWFDSNDNTVADDMLINDGATISYTTTGDATYYARFKKLVTQNYIRQIKNGENWEDTYNNNIGTLDNYTHTDVEVDTSVSSTATAGSFYDFVGWYDSDGKRVADDMVINNGATISYTAKVDATYYARFEIVPYTLTVSKINGDKSTEDNKELLAGVTFTLYRKNDSGEKITVETATTALNDDNQATVVFKNILPDTEYYLEETNVPEGYQLPDSQLKITFDSSNGSVKIEGIDGISTSTDNNEINIEIANYRIPIIIPSTGTIFTGDWFITAGFLLIVTAAIGLCIFVKNKMTDI